MKRSLLTVVSTVNSVYPSENNCQRHHKQSCVSVSAEYCRQTRSD